MATGWRTSASRGYEQILLGYRRGARCACRARGLRVASPEVGYAWSTAGSLWITTDGAASWQRGGLIQVLSLETAAGWVWSIAGAQPYPNIWRAPVGSTAWTNLGLTPDRSATLTVHSDVAYVVGQQGAGPIAPSLDVFAGTQPVRHESLPCVRGQTYVPFAPLGCPPTVSSTWSATS